MWRLSASTIDQAYIEPRDRMFQHDQALNWDHWF